MTSLQCCVRGALLAFGLLAFGGIACGATPSTALVPAADDPPEASASLHDSAAPAGSVVPPPAPTDARMHVPIMRRDHIGAIACASPDARDDEGNPATCELSAAAALGAEVFVLNDKPAFGSAGASVFAIDPIDPLTHLLTHLPAPRGISDATLASFRKWEDAEPWTDGGLLITTGFDRIRDDAGWDGFNGLLLWQPGSAPKIIGASTREGVTSSRRLRERFAAALADHRYPEGPPYFKIEGLAGLPDGRVLFGVRELGRSHVEVEFAMIVLAARDLDAIEHEGPEKLWSFDAAGDARFDHPLGLSGMTYDAQRGGLWLTTSWETDETQAGLGGHLWWLDPGELDKGGAPQLVSTPEGSPLRFAHKPEAVTVLSDGRLLIVHDDDRVTGPFADPHGQVSRALHESVFEVLSVVPDQPSGMPASIQSTRRQRSSSDG